MPKVQGAGTAHRGRPAIPNALRRQTTRAAVLRAAAEAFDESGYLATSLGDIVARTNLTKGAVYFHFSSKDALAAELAQFYFARLEEAAAAGADAVDGLSQMMALTRAVAEIGRVDPVFRAGARLATERELISLELPDAYEWWVRTIGALGRRARRDGSLSGTVTPSAAGRVVATFMIGAQRLTVGERPDQLLRRLNELWRLLEPALRSA